MNENIEQILGKLFFRYPRITLTTEQLYLIMNECAKNKPDEFQITSFILALFEEIEAQNEE